MMSQNFCYFYYSSVNGVFYHDVHGVHGDARVVPQEEVHNHLGHLDLLVVVVHPIRLHLEVEARSFRNRLVRLAVLVVLLQSRGLRVAVVVLRIAVDRNRPVVLRIAVAAARTPSPPSSSCDGVRACWHR